MTLSTIAIEPLMIPMSDRAKAKVRSFETEMMSLPQIDLDTQHLLHAGMYARTIHLPAGAVITGVEIKLATILIVSGTVNMFAEGGPVQLEGYNVLSALPGRKQAFMAITDVDMTMLFPSDAETVEDAENRFTDEADLLLSRRSSAAGG